jgi:hypothetical protein
MSATTLPLVAVMLLMAAIEIAIVDVDYRYPHFVFFILFLTICFVISDGRSALQSAERWNDGHSALVNALRAAGAH